MLEYDNTLSVTEYCELRSAVEWPPITEEQAGWRIKIVIVSAKEKEPVYEESYAIFRKGNLY